ncbi:enoyl-CoA hydratase [Paraburkholderia sp. BL18I3N2]|uniref:enoyl-CoA hydratase/isomerase family protein n=1 Tax=Paraburkholderia sp. BL18I3N2 TaxID=1938799 RepID=UPI000D423DF9|nr:enoyl-CoA hydratase-related protein [Paraburkholderia sp. BL18I3N2]PRX27392.1 enoyl-CoA hydratase [Paraburkholderia sp. BL18I3N2]
MSQTHKAVSPDLDEASVIYEQADGVVTLTLNRPRQLNALNSSLARQLVECVQRAETKAETRVIVIKGAGLHFMAGGDLHEFRLASALPSALRDAAFEALIDDAHAAIRALHACAPCVVGSVRGAVAGFGIGLLSACDLALCADDAFFKLAYSQIGASPDGAATYALPRWLGHKQAMELTLLSERLDASAAERLGLVNKVVPAGVLDEELGRLVKHLTGLPALAVAKSKLLIRQGVVASLDEQLDAERNAFIQCAGTPDFAEGVSAFLERRPAQFGGSTLQ